MSGWELSLIDKLPCDLDGAALSAITTCRTAISVAQIELPLPRARKQIPVGELFRVRAQSHEQITAHGDLSLLHRLGFEWGVRSLVVEGDVGSGLGTRMHSGSIQVRGNAGSGAACQLRGGLIQLSGSTGDDLGCPLPGRRSGMSGGRVVILGRAGHQVGRRMRRGTIVVHGDCGDGVGIDMVAGTIAVGGNTGDLIAAGMKRGTLILAQPKSLDTIRFVGSGVAPCGISRLMADDIRHHSPQLAMLLTQRLDRFLGDCSVGGRGEIWQSTLRSV